MGAPPKTREADRASQAKRGSGNDRVCGRTEERCRRLRSLNEQCREVHVGRNFLRPSASFRRQLPASSGAPALSSDHASDGSTRITNASRSAAADGRASGTSMRSPDGSRAVIAKRLGAVITSLSYLGCRPPQGSSVALISNLPLTRATIIRAGIAGMLTPVPANG